MIEHVVRRGFEHASVKQMLKRAVEDGPKVQMPTWGIVLLVATFAVFIVFLSAVEYTLKDVVATLSMVETPSAAITVSTPNEPAEREEKEGLLETAPAITLVHQKPITSSIRGTIKHLVEQAGKFSRWRGFRLHALWAFAFSVTTNLLNGLIPMRFPLRIILISGVSGALCANLHAAWTHKVVSMPTTTSFWQRVPSRSSWKVLALPAAVNAAMPYIALYIVRGLVMLTNLDTDTRRGNFENNTRGEWIFLIFRAVLVLVAGVACSLFLCLPAIVTLVRVEASILPEDQDTIVPFDRTFGGKVVPKILGGTGAVTFLDAWRSFNWEARRRLVKLYVKIFFVLTGLFLVLAHVLAFEVFVVMGPALGRFLAEAKGQGFVPT